MLSTVSGGSIISGFLANQMVAKAPGAGVEALDWECDVAEPFRAFVNRDLRTGPFLAHVLWNWALPRFRVRNLEGATEVDLRNYASTSSRPDRCLSSARPTYNLWLALVATPVPTTAAPTAPLVLTSPCTGCLETYRAKA